jgi:hypothetical protein
VDDSDVADGTDDDVPFSGNSRRHFFVESKSLIDYASGELEGTLYGTASRYSRW